MPTCKCQLVQRSFKTECIFFVQIFVIFALFFVQTNHTFEIGGRKKGQKQIERASDGYIVKDDIETRFANVIPLWHFGLMY